MISISAGTGGERFTLAQLGALEIEGDEDMQEVRIRARIGGGVCFDILAGYLPTKEE